MSGRWYYAGDGMGEQVGARLPQRKRPGRVLHRTDISQWAEGKAKPAKTDVLTRSSREVLLINWFLPVIREAKHIEFPDD